jgi:TonB family protein
MKGEQPDVPTEALKESSGGVAVVQVAVGKDGNAIDAWILASSGSGAFDRSALTAARSSVYSEPVSYCRPVNGLALFSAVFQRE